MPRLRKRAFGLLVGAGVLFFIGTNVQAGWLFVLSALMLGAFAAGWLLAIRGASGIEFARRVPDRVHQGDEVLIDVAVTNAGRRTRRGIVVRDPHLDAVDIWVGSIRPGERPRSWTRLGSAATSPPRTRPTSAPTPRTATLPARSFR